MVEIVRGVPLALESSAALERLDRALRAQGVEPHPACRYSRYKTILQARRTGASLKMSTEEQQYATAELLQMDWIVACFLNDDSIWPLIEEAFFQDPTVPHGEGVHSPGRDRQFELYLAARLRMAGLPVFLSEPDIRTSLADWPLVIAAKRVKSRKGFLRQVKSARDQIRRASMDGIVAIDYSLVAAQDKPDFRGDLDAGHAWAKDFSSREFHAHWPAVMNTVSTSPEVFGALIFVRHFQLHPNLRTHIISELLFARPLCKETDHRVQKMASIESVLRSSVVPSGAGAS